MCSTEALVSNITETAPVEGKTTGGASEPAPGAVGSAAHPQPPTAGAHSLHHRSLTISKVTTHLSQPQLLPEGEACAHLVLRQPSFPSGAKEIF